MPERDESKHEAKHEAKDETKQAARARSPKPGAGAPDKDNPADPIHEEAERLKSSTSADRSKRTHKQSSKRGEKT